jgi:hypothetical protein
VSAPEPIFDVAQLAHVEVEGIIWFGSPLPAEFSMQGTDSVVPETPVGA